MVEGIRKDDIEAISEGLKEGRQRMLSRAISILENEEPEADSLLKEFSGLAGSDYRIGVTGPPGAGKSSLVSKLVKYFLQKHHRVGIVAVDPTSPFSGGAVLGDRIRMNEIMTDPRIFIRSMATRGSLGGLNKTAQGVADLMSVAGMDIILFETVGVGQGELDVARATDTTIVILVPESGDSIQAMKAGLMEIADIFVINKADREGAEQMRIELENMLQLRSVQSSWMVPIVKTIAIQDTGVKDLFAFIEKHQNYLKESGLIEDRQRQRIIEVVRHHIQNQLEQKFWTKRRKEILEKNAEDVVRRKISVYDLLEKLQNSR